MFFLISAACCTVLFTMCKKDKNTTPDPPAPDQQRLSSIHYSVDGYNFQAWCRYDGTRMTTMILTMDTVYEYQKLAMTYTGNLIASLTYSDKAGADWNETERIEVKSYAGSNPLETQDRWYKDNGEDEVNKRLFIYSNSLLSRTEDYHQNGSNWIASSVILYEYDGQNRILRTVDTMGYYGYITSYTYEGTKMVSWKQQSNLTGTFKDYLSTQFTYSGDLLTKVTQLTAGSSVWEKSMETVYTYNDRGNLIAEQTSVYGTISDTYLIEYAYEPGQGNFRSFAWLLSEDILLPGDPTPMPVRPSVLRNAFASHNVNPAQQH